MTETGNHPSGWPLSDSAEQSEIYTRDVSGAESPSAAVVTTVAELAGRPVDSLSPLYDAVDPDALDALVDRDAPVSVQFTYEGYDVSLRADSLQVCVRSNGA